MLEHLNKYYKLYMALGGLLITAIGYVIYLELRIPKSADEMSEIRATVNAVPVLMKTIEFDSIDTAHAMEMRKLRVENEAYKDSMELVRAKERDSILYDKLDRQTVQLEQFKEIVKKHHGN